MEPDDHATPFCWVLYLLKARKPTRCSRGFWTAGQHHFDSMWGRLVIKLHVADPGDLMQGKSWMLRVGIDNGLAYRRRQGPFVLLGNGWWRTGGSNEAMPAWSKRLAFA